MLIYNILINFLINFKDVVFCVKMINLLFVKEAKVNRFYVFKSIIKK